MNVKLNEILDQIYGGGMDEKDCAQIIRRIHQRLEDEFFEEAPNFDQQKILSNLLKVADSVESFFGKPRSSK